MTKNNKNEQKYINKTFHLSHNAIALLDHMAERLSEEAGIDISKGKVLELIILNTKDKPLSELLTVKK